MRNVPDWWIQGSWWASGIFGTGAIWYFLSTREYRLSIWAGVATLAFALLAILLHRKKDEFQSEVTHIPQPPVRTDKLVTADWWDASELRKDYMNRGLDHFHWSSADLVAEREQAGYEVVYLEDAANNVQSRIVNKSGQVLLARRDA